MFGPPQQVGLTKDGCILFGYTAILDKVTTVAPVWFLNDSTGQTQVFYATDITTMELVPTDVAFQAVYLFLKQSIQV